MKGTLLKMSFLLFFVSLLISCKPPIASKTTTSQTAPEVVTPLRAPGKAAWQEDWERTIAAARKEGKLYGWSSLGATVRQGMSEGFQKAYGMDIDWVAGSSATIFQKLVAERQNGLYLADVYVGGSTSLFTELKPKGGLDRVEPILVSQIVEPDKWPEGRIPYLDKDKTVVGFVSMVGAPVLINTNLVKEGELKHFHDLLNPKWRGKIIMHDPTGSGAGAKWFYMVVVKQLGLDFARELVKQEPLITRDQRLQTEWIARGKYAIATSPKISVVVDFIAVGAPIKEINVKPEYTTTSGGNLALINKAPNPNAAKLFINWLLTREGQTIFTVTNSSPSQRIDVAPAAKSPARIKKPGVNYFESESEELIIESGEKGYQIAKEVFAPLLK